MPERSRPASGSHRPAVCLPAVALLLAAWLILALNISSQAECRLAQSHGQIVDGSFDATDTSAAWETTVYGGPADVERDGIVRRMGGHALRVSAETPADAALGQEVALGPGRFYRLTGWVRTRDLDPGSAPVFGTLQVQLPHGAGILARGQNHRGSADWTRVAVAFRAPADGRVRICLFFVGFGRGTGAAWFDDIRLEAMNPTTHPIVVRREPLVDARINPLQYGQFVEYLCDMIPSMWAEKLYDGDFDGVSLEPGTNPYKFMYLRETDFKEKPWYPSGQTNRAEYTRDPEVKVGGNFSQRIVANPGAPCTVSISQDGIAVSHGVRCVFTCWLRAEGITSPVRVRLHSEQHVYAECALDAAAEWKKFSAPVTPDVAGTDANATLTIEFKGPGTLWIDCASLMPDDTVGGWRKDVVEALRALNPGVIRFGGSALDDPNLGDFEWRNTIGDPDHRIPFRAWGGLQKTGPGLEEIVQLCGAVRAEPLICVRTRNRSAQDAADEVQYFNGAVTTPMGALRARNGHPEPYGVRFWQVGNERSGAQYEALLPQFCRAMREADPTIKLMAAFPSEGVVRGAGQYIDYLCPHQYGCDDLAGKAEELDQIREMLARLAPGRRIRVGVTEWNTTAGDAGPRRAMLWTLANALACSRYHNLMHRYADLVEISNRSNLCNSFCSGIIQTDNHRLYKTPTYYAQQLYATLAGDVPLKIDPDAATYSGLDVSATASQDGKTVTLFVVNDGLEPLPRPLDLRAFGAEGTAEVWTLGDREHAGEPDAANSFAAPERVSVGRSQVALGSGRLTYNFPALTLTVIRFTPAGVR